MAIHPVGIKNTFASHFVFWTLFLPLLTIIFVPLVVPDQNIDQQEVAMVGGFNVDLAPMTESANKTFSALFIESGAMGASEEVFASKFEGEGFLPHNGFAAKWIRGVWLMIYKAIWRFYALLHIFFLPVLFLTVPAAVDGFMIRARKKYRFESYNPVFFYSSTHALTLVLGLFVFLPLAPITLSGNILAGMLVGLAISVWVATSNFQTGA